jgi:hypothetical protein
MVEPLRDSRSSDAETLSEVEAKILEFEQKWWKYAAAKESSIRELFDMSPSRYYEVLNSLIDRDDALAASPMLIKRLRRMREVRLAQRQGRPIA